MRRGIATGAAAARAWQAGCATRRSVRKRSGSALILVLVMTLSLAGLAISAVLLASSSALLQRYYDKEKDFRFYATAAAELVQASVQRDTTVSVPGDTAYAALAGANITDAAGATNTTIQVNGYAAYTGDTAGTYIPFLTILAQAYDGSGVRSVQRHDLRAEAFSRYAMLVDTFLPNTSVAAGTHVHGRVHGNRQWISGTSPGPDYYDTVSAGSWTAGAANYHGLPVMSPAKRIRWPTSASLSNLPTLAAAGSLSFAPVFTYTGSQARSGGNDINMSGEFASGVSAQSGTRLSFKPVDVNNNGVRDANEGFFELFDLATGIDTASLRVDPRGATSPNTSVYDDANVYWRGNTLIQSQCGLLIRKANGRREFFPVGRFRERWVRAYVKDSSVAPAVSVADTATMGGSTFVAGTYQTDQIPSDAAVATILGYGAGYSRCFPAGSPYLMLMERFVDVSCAIDSTVNNTPFGWGAVAAGCPSSKRYGGQDTTFTANVRRCWLAGTSGQCSGTVGSSGQVRLGSWRAFGGTSGANPPTAVIQGVEKPYLWPISTTYNAASRGVIYSSSTAPLYVSDTLRGYATLYAHGRIVLIDDLVYDRDPLAPDALCRNMLGLIADTSIKVASSALNFYRLGPQSNYVFLGTPHFNLNAMTMALSTVTSTASVSDILAHGTVGVEDSSTTISSTVVVSCNGVSSLGGCFNHTGSEVMKVFHQVNGGANTGLVRNLAQDPCQAQATNRRPPFFPLTGRYVAYKEYDVDPQITSTWAQIKAYLARLRGNNRPIP